MTAWTLFKTTLSRYDVINGEQTDLPTTKSLVLNEDNPLQDSDLLFPYRKSSSFRKLKLYSKSNAANWFFFFFNLYPRWVKESQNGKQKLDAVMGIIPQFCDAALVLLSVTSQNSTPKCFSLHATITWFYTNSMMPGMREVTGPAILCTQRTLLLKGPGWQVTYYHRGENRMPVFRKHVEKWT